MTTKPRSAGNHLRFFRAGEAFTIPEAGIAGPSSLPGPLDPLWIEAGAVSSLKITNDGTEVIVMGPNPGTLQPIDVIRPSRKLTLNATLEELPPVAWELLFGSFDREEATTDYIPLNGPQKKFWVEVKQYDSNEVLFNTLHLFCEVSVEGAVEFGDKNVTVDLKMIALRSSAAKGTTIAADE